MQINKVEAKLSHLHLTTPLDKKVYSNLIQFTEISGVNKIKYVRLEKNRFFKSGMYSLSFSRTNVSMLNGTLLFVYHAI